MLSSASDQRPLTTVRQAESEDYESSLQKYDSQDYDFHQHEHRLHDELYSNHLSKFEKQIFEHIKNMDNHALQTLL